MMKKKILGVALIATMAVAAGWNFNQSKNETGMSDLALANVEAFAKYEIDVGIPCIISTATCYEINDEFGHTIISGYK